VVVGLVKKDRIDPLDLPRHASGYGMEVYQGFGIGLVRPSIAIFYLATKLIRSVTTNFVPYCWIGGHTTVPGRSAETGW
jgi:hypothetical protein